MTDPSLAHEPVLVGSFDGTEIAVRVMGDGDGVPLLVANGIGANLAIWKRALIDVVRQRPVVTWDHRGLLSSLPPASDRLDPGAQAEDAIAAMDHLGFEQFALVSWSNGSRVALEIAHRYPEMTRCLILLNGGYGHPASRALRLELGSLFPLVASVGKYFGEFFGGALRRLVARPDITGFIRQSGMVAATADTPALIELLRGIAECDQRLFLETFQQVAGDSAYELLSEITTPALLIAGDHDRFVSRSLIEETARGLGAKTIYYEGATHYLPIEFPARLSDDIREFLGSTLGNNGV